MAKQYRASCIGCKQTSLWSGPKTADEWAKAHRKLSGHSAKLEKREKPAKV